MYDVTYMLFLNNLILKQIVLTRVVEEDEVPINKTILSIFTTSCK